MSLRKHLLTEHYEMMFKRKLLKFIYAIYLLLIYVTYTLLILVPAILVFEMLALDGPTVEQGKERAEPLIAAIEIYRREYSKGPSELAQLVPEFLEEVPKPAWRGRYTYFYQMCSDSYSYGLSFRLGRTDDFCGFNSNTEEWTCTDSYWHNEACFPQQ